MIILISMTTHTCYSLFYYKRFSTYLRRLALISLYLKHYVNRQNILAQKLDLHLMDEGLYDISFLEKSVHIYRLDSKLQASGFEHLIIKAMKHLNPNSRGVLGEQIKKIKQAMLNYKFGPLTLTRGSKAFVSFNSILISNSILVDKDITRRYGLLSLSEYKKILEVELLKNDKFPHWVIVKSSSPLKGFNFNKKLCPYNIELSRSLENKSHIAAIKLFSQWSKDKNKHKKLNLTF